VDDSALSYVSGAGSQPLLLLRDQIEKELNLRCERTA